MSIHLVSGVSCLYTEFNKEVKLVDVPADTHWRIVEYMN